MECDLREYFRAAFEDKLLVQMPEREDDFLTPATRLLEKKREMIEVEQALNTQKEVLRSVRGSQSRRKALQSDLIQPAASVPFGCGCIKSKVNIPKNNEFHMKAESLQQRRAELEHKEEKLKDSLFKFDKFLKENDSKRKRALRKAGEERQLAAQKEREAIRVQVENIQLQSRKEKLLHRQGRNSIYQHYLQRVLERTEEFQEVQEMIDRFNTLMATQEKLLKRELVHQETIEKERTRLLHYQEETHSQILELNNQIADLQGALERTRAVVLEWESGWAQIQNTAAENTLRLGRIRMAALNLFQTITKQMHIKSDISIEDTELQLEKIKMCFLDLDAIHKDLKKSDLTPLTTAMSSTN